MDSEVIIRESGSVAHSGSDNSDTKKKMLTALETSLGVVSVAAARVGISRQTHYRWMKSDPEYRRAVDDVAEFAVDYVESKLFNRIEDNDVTSIIFFLKTRGKKRGYVERQEFAGVPDQPLLPDFDVSKLDPRDRKTMLDLIQKMK